jgi:hypothetical protein
MNPIRYYLLAVCWLYVAVRESAGSEELAQALAVAAAKVRQVETREARQAKAETDQKPAKKKRGKKAPKKIHQARVSGEVVRVAGYDLEVARNGTRENRGQLVTVRGNVQGTASDFASVIEAINQATGGEAEALLVAIRVLNAGESAHDRFWEHSKYTDNKRAVYVPKYRVSPRALLERAAQAAVSAA